MVLAAKITNIKILSAVYICTTLDLTDSVCRQTTHPDTGYVSLQNLSSRCLMCTPANSSMWHQSVYVFTSEVITTQGVGNSNVNNDILPSMAVEMYSEW